MLWSTFSLFKIENLVLRASRRSRRRGSEKIGFAIDQPCHGFQVSAPPPAKKTAGQIEKETLAMKFHTSVASGLNNGQSNRKRNYIFVINDVVSYEVSGVSN